MELTIVQFDFAFRGPWGDGLEERCRGLAADIAAEPGLIWKLWGENEAEGRANGIYLFAERGAAEAYLRKHTARLMALGVTEPVARLFSVHAPLSRATRAPV